MEYRNFGQTGMQLSNVALGGLLAHYEGAVGHPPPEEKRAIYLRALELGVNLFDLGYGDEVHIPDELKGSGGDHYFSLKVGAPPPDQLLVTVDKHLANIRRDAIDILRVHQPGYREVAGLAECVAKLKADGKVRSVCLIRHHLDAQEDYVANGPDLDADADLVIYNYVCRWQEAGLEKSLAAGRGVLIMKSLGGQWISWQDKATIDWEAADESVVAELSPRGEGIRGELPLVYPIVSGPWHELAEPGETVPSTERAISWVLDNPAVTSVLVAFASVAELEQGVGIEELV